MLTKDPSVDTATSMRSFAEVPAPSGLGSSHIRTGRAVKGDQTSVAIESARVWPHAVSPSAAGRRATPTARFVTGPPS